MDDPTSPPLIGPSTIVVVNDARHQLQPEFLQRTTPYFFDVDSITQQYKWAKVRVCCIHVYMGVRDFPSPPAGAWVAKGDYTHHHRRG